MTPMRGSSNRSQPSAAIIGGNAMGMRISAYMRCRPGALVRSTSHASGTAKAKPVRMAPAPNINVLRISS